MKKLLLFLVLFCGISCSEKKEDILKKEIEKNIITGMNDPDSYEFISFSIDSSMVKIYDDLYKLHLKKKKTTPFPKLSYKYNGTFTFRGKNEFGALILADYTFKADSTYKLLYLFGNVNDTVYRDVDIMTHEVEEMMKK